MPTSVVLELLDEVEQLRARDPLDRLPIGPRDAGLSRAVGELALVGHVNRLRPDLKRVHPRDRPPVTRAVHRRDG